MLPNTQIRSVSRADVDRIGEWLGDSQISSSWFGHYGCGEPIHRGYDPNHMLESRDSEWHQVFDNPNRMIFSLYNDEGDHISILYSDSARIDEQNNNLQANGNVYVISDSGYTLTTSELLWDNRYEMIVAEDSVMFTHPEGDTLYGIGFESEIDLERFKIFRPFGIIRGGI